MTMTLGSELRKWRKSKGWSQERAAQHLGVSQGAYSQWESGNKRLGLQSFRVLRRKLRGIVDVESLA